MTDTFLRSELTSWHFTCREPKAASNYCEMDYSFSSGEAPTGRLKVARQFIAG